MLQKQTIEIHFDKGLNAKVDPKLLPPGSLVRLENCCFDDTNTIKRRPGQIARTTSVDAGGSLPSALMAFNHREVMGQIGTNGEAHVYSVSQAKWHHVEDVPMTRVSYTQVMRNTATQSAADVCGLGTIELWAWEDSRGGVRVSVRDAAGDLPLIEDFELDASGAQPRCFVIGINLCVVYLSGANVKVSKVATTSVASGFTTSTLKTNAQTSDGLLDAVAITSPAKAFIAFKSNSSDNIDVFSWDGTTASASTTLASGAQEALHVNVFGSSVAVVWGQASTTVLRASVGTQSLTFGASLAVDASVPDVARITSAEVSGELRIAYDTGAGYETTIRQAQITSSSTVSRAATTWMYGAGLSSNAFTLNGDIAVAITHDDDLQPTLFVAMLTGDMAGTVAARTLSSLSGGLDDSGRLPNVIGTNTHVFPALARGRLVISEEHDVTPIGIARVSLGDITTHDKARAELGGLALIPGAVPMVFDGVGFVEAGFNLYPHDMSASVIGVGALSAGTYSWAAVLEWVDAQGNLHRSAPSVPFSLTVTDGQGAGIDLVEVTQTRRAAAWPTTDNQLPGRTAAKLVFYRTVADGTVFFRLNQPSGWGWPDSDPVFSGSIFADTTTSDDQLQANEPLYTTGGVLENEPPPACRYVWVHQKRWFVAGIDSDPYGFAYSHELVNGEAPAFSEVLRGRVPPEFGVITGGASMDDKCFLFCENGTWCVTGQGPDITGGQNGYSEPQRITSAVGCLDHRSIVDTGEGLMFLSPRGIRLLNRSLSIDMVGVPVDSLATACVAALMDEVKNQVRFYTGTDVLVWDFLWQQWSTYGSHTAIDALTYRGDPVHLQSDGTTFFPGGTTDNGSDISAVVETGWISFAGVQAIQRVWKTLVLGTCTTEQDLSLAVAYDFEEDYSETKTVDTEAQGVIAGHAVDANAISVWRADEAATGDTLVDVTGNFTLACHSGTNPPIAGKIDGARGHAIAHGVNNVPFDAIVTPTVYSRLQGAISFERWVMPTSPAWTDYSKHYIVSMGTTITGASPILNIRVDTATRLLEIEYESGAKGSGTITTIVATGLPLNMSAWNHIGVAQDLTGRVYFEVNGSVLKLTGQPIPSRGNSPLFTNFRMGTDTAGFQDWAGYMDDGRMSDVLRTTSEMVANWRAGSQRTFQFRHHIKRQKCEAIRLKLTATGSDGVVGFSSMAFEVGQKRGAAKLSSGRTI